MTENITSLWVRSGSIAAINSSRKWHALPELMKYSTLRLILLLGILFILALSANAETWEPITCINVNQDLRQSQNSDGNGLATITMQNGAWYYWEQKSKNPWDGLMHFTPTQDKDGKGYGVRFTIKAKDGYRITKVIFRDTEGNGTYRNEDGIFRLSVENNNYSKRWDKNSLDNYVDPSKKGKYQDNNNMVFENTDDNPVQSLTFKCHTYNWADQFKCRMIMVICKKVPDYKFSKGTYNLKTGQSVNNILTSATKGWNLSGQTITYNPQGVVHITQDATNGFVAIADKPGTTTVTAAWPGDNDYVKYSISAKFNVSRYDQPATLSSTSAITMNAWDTPNAPVVQNLPADYKGSVTWKSSDESIAKIQNNKIVFGDTGYGKTATITVTLSQTDKYNGKTLSFTVKVNNEMRIASKADWEQFCSQVRSGNSGINATLTQDITDPVTTSMFPKEVFSSGSLVSLAKVSYSGTFEGGNHSIALNLSGGLCTAPFSAVNGATIRNLSVTGRIAASDMFAAGLVGIVLINAVTIDHCQSSVAITSTVDGEGNHGGIVGDATAPVKINNSVFSGSITGVKTNQCGGLVGWIGTNGAGSKITNSLITATYSLNASGSNSVAVNAQNATISNVYFLNALGDHPAGAEQVSDAQMKSGYVAWHLQNGQSSAVWGQSINGTRTDAAPLFSTEAAKKVYRVAHVSSLDDKVMQEKFYNAGQKAEGLSTASLSSYVNNNYKDVLTRWFQMTDAGKVSSPVSADQNVKVTIKNNEFFSISNAETWKQFCDYVNDVSPKVSAKMTSNVTLDASSPMAGTKKAYAGKFDGGSYTLTVNYTGSGQATAPFNIVEGAVIENLKTAGTIRQTATGDDYPQSHASGLVGAAYGVTINNCEVAVAISFTLTGDQDQHSGGFVGHGEGKVITMNNCKFSGSFSGPEGSRTSGIAGLVGWSAGSGSSFNNCYVAGTYKNIVDVHPLVYTSDNITVSGSNNFYSFNGIGASTWRTKGTATAVTSDEAKNGSVTYALQHGTGTKGWSQNLPGDNEPMLVFNGEKEVNKVEFVYNNTVKITRYANTGGKLLGGVPTLQDLLGNAYNDTYYYETFSFTPDFTNDSPVAQDTRVTVNIKSSDFFTISNRETWEKFCALVNGGNTKLAAKMTKDITEAVNTMAGTSTRPYQGTFDGQGHTLNVNLSGGQNVAPFPVASNATIENLRVTGTIAASGKYAAGIVGNVVVGQPTTISDCESNVTINSTVSGDGTHGGIVGATSNNGYVVISNCAFTGVMSGAETNNCGGFIGWAGTGAAKSSISNSLVAGAFNTGTEGAATFTRNPRQVDITNCYYLNAYGTAQGTLVTDEQLKNGYVASKLQEGQQQSVWAFRLGEGTMLHAFSHPDYNESEENPNYVYYDAGSWHCDHYQLSDSKSYQDSYVGFTADKITYLRSLKQGRRYTWCQPYSLTYSDDMPFKAYMLSKNTGGNAVFSQVSNGSPLEALMPYLIVMKADKERIDYNHSAIVKSYDTSLGYVERGDIKMMGTVKTISNSEASKLGAYTLQNDGSWKKVMTEDASAYIPPFRAYLTVDGGAAGAKIGSVFSDGTTTSVENIILEDNDGTTHIYDLRGIDRGTDFDRLPAGVYIRGGKKVVKR